jgi:hypothetical protein
VIEEACQLVEVCDDLVVLLTVEDRIVEKPDTTAE